MINYPPCDFCGTCEHCPAHDYDACVHPCRDCGEPWHWDQPVCLNRRCPTHYGSWHCPNCGDTWAEKHPYNFVLRCFNCKEWLATGEGQLFIFPLSEYRERKRDSSNG